MKNAMKQHNLSPADIAKELDVSTSQIYKWMREGISVNNKHFPKLRKLLPEIVPKEVTLKNNGEDDERFKSGTNRKEIELTALPETDVTLVEKEFKSSLFPKITFKKRKENN